MTSLSRIPIKPNFAEYMRNTDPPHKRNCNQYDVAYNSYLHTLLYTVYTNITPYQCYGIENTPSTTPLVLCALDIPYRRGNLYELVQTRQRAIFCFSSHTTILVIVFVCRLWLFSHTQMFW